MLCAIPAAQHIQKDHSLCHSSGHGHPRLSELEFTPQQRTEKDLAQRFSYPAEQRAVGHPWPKTQVVWMNSASTMCCGRLRSSLCTAAQLHSCTAARVAPPAAAAPGRTRHLSQRPVRMPVSSSASGVCSSLLCSFSGLSPQ